MAAFDLLTSAAPLMKRYYDDRRVYSMAYKNRPLYAWIPKKTGIVGEAGGYNVPVTIDDIPGESADFGSAVLAREGDSHEVWQNTRVKRYATATLDWETVRAMSNSMGAFMKAVTPRINSAINQLANSTAWALYRDGTGARGSSVTANIDAVGDTIILDNFEDARSFSLGRTCVVSATASGGALLDSGSTAKVTAIDIKTGTITFDDVPVAWDVAVIFIFMLGDHSTGTALRVIEGMGSWGVDPTTVSAGQFFKGVERAKFKDKLLMLHETVTIAAAGDISAGVRRAAAIVQANEGSPDALFIGPLRWAELESDLASQSRYEMMLGSDGRTGFDSIVINAGGGKINVVADPWCPEGNGYMLERDTWSMFSIDRFPDFVSEDGQRLARIMDADEVEFRMGGYYNTVCRAPGHNLVINFA